MVQLAPRITTKNYFHFVIQCVITVSAGSAAEYFPIPVVILGVVRAHGPEWHYGNLHLPSHLQVAESPKMQCSELAGYHNLTSASH